MWTVIENRRDQLWWTGRNTGQLKAGGLGDFHVKLEALVSFFLHLNFRIILQDR